MLGGFLKHVARMLSTVCDSYLDNCTGVNYEYYKRKVCLACRLPPTATTYEARVLPCELMYSQ
jgi:hypothetical protein